MAGIPVLSRDGSIAVSVVLRVWGASPIVRQGRNANVSIAAGGHSQHGTEHEVQGDHAQPDREYRLAASDGVAAPADVRSEGRQKLSLWGAPYALPSILDSAPPQPADHCPVCRQCHAD